GAHVEEVVERVLERQLLAAAEARRPRQLVRLRGRKTARAEAGAAAGERRRHAVRDAEAVEQRGKRPGVLDRIVGTVDVEQQVSSFVLTAGDAGIHSWTRWFSCQPAVKRRRPFQKYWGYSPWATPPPFLNDSISCGTTPRIP